jgi:Asp/Glu/hydantoin racemase
MSTMRILYQSMTPVNDLPNYAQALERHAQRVCSPGTEVVLHGMPAEFFEGSSPTEVYRYPYAKHKIASAVLDIGRRAEVEGYDAYVLGSFSEPFLAELRSTLNITVTSMAESCALVACSLAEKFAFVSLSPVSARRLRTIIDKHQLTPRVSGFHALPRPVNEHALNAAFADPTALIQNFSEAARSAIDQGADLVVPAEGVLTEVLFFGGLHSLEGATVLDCVGTTLCHTETLVNLRQRAGMSVGRRWAWLQPPAELVDRINRNLARPSS